MISRITTCVFTLLEGMELLIGQPQLLLLILQGEVLPAQLDVLQGLGFGLLLQLHHLVHQELGQALVTLLHCSEETHTDAHTHTRVTSCTSTSVQCNRIALRADLYKFQIQT